MSNWFPSGPSISYIPFPIPEPEKPWGSSACDKCAGIICSGHFLMPEKAEVSTLPVMCKPPSAITKQGFISLKDQHPSDAFIQDMARQCLLPSDEVQIWIEHLSQVQRNRKRGVQKAAETKRRTKEQNKTSSASVVCVICGDPYEDITENVED